MADHMFALSTVNCSRYLSLPQFDEPSKLKIAELFNKYKVGSVVDIQDILDTTAILPDLAYDEISRALLSSPRWTQPSSGSSPRRTSFVHWAVSMVLSSMRIA